MNEYKTFLRADGNGKLEKVLEWESGDQIAFPVTKSGEIRWFDDSKLVRRTAVA